MNKLEANFDGIPISVEQAYAIFLNARSELTLEEYLVYSHLVRIGYFVAIHNPEHDHDKYAAAEERKRLKKEDEMIWSVLMKKLKMPYSHEFIEKERDLYLNTKTEMNKHCIAISGQNHHTDYFNDDDDDDDDGNQAEPPLKKLKSVYDDGQVDTFLDILKTQRDYLSHEQQFKEFSYISRKDDDESIDCGQLKFSFDVFLPKRNFRRTEDLANYRLFLLT